MGRVWGGVVLLGAAALLSISAASAATLSTREYSRAVALSAESPGIPLYATPRVVLRFCRDRAHLRKFPVLCPTRWPHISTSVVTGSGSSVLGPSFYWWSFNDQAGFDDGDDGHLVLGGQRPPFSLKGAVKQTWPRPGQPQPVKQLWLPTPQQKGGIYGVQRPARILRASTVGGARALVLVTPAYPAGGFMGGHVIVLWNWHGHGYFISLHYDGSQTGVSYTVQERASAALVIARSAHPLTLATG
jgi:hypothetical protein